MDNHCGVAGVHQGDWVFPPSPLHQLPCEARREDRTYTGAGVSLVRTPTRVKKIEHDLGPRVADPVDREGTVSLPDGRCGFGFSVSGFCFGASGAPLDVGTRASTILPWFAFQTCTVVSPGSSGAATRPSSIAQTATAAQRLPQLPLQSMVSAVTETCPNR